jgi:hypothetical protein
MLSYWRQLAEIHFLLRVEIQFDAEMNQIGAVPDQV